MPALIDHLCRHNQYSNFEDFFLESTQSYYAEESKAEAQILKDHPTAFFEKMLGRVEQEIDRGTLLPVESWKALREATEQGVWIGRTAWLSNHSAFHLISLVSVLLETL